MNFRFEPEGRLKSELLAETDIQRALEVSQKRNLSGHGFFVERLQLARALRVTRGMSPAIWRSIDSCIERLGVQAKANLYVRADAAIQASMHVNHSGQVEMTLSSRLLETFTEPELHFVIGHELGHFIFEHLELPAPLIDKAQDRAGQILSVSTRLKLFEWHRMAEISADRAGLVCCQSLDASAAGFFKLTSGLNSSLIKADLESFAQQVEALHLYPEALPDGFYDNHLDCFSTHPYSPIRIRALLAFARTQRFAATEVTFISDEEAERLILKDLELMKASYLSEKTAQAELMKKGLLYASLVVAHADGSFSKQEAAALQAMLGREIGQYSAHSAQESWNFILPELKAISLEKRGQVVQHVAVVAAADGISPEERAAIHVIATQLQVAPSVADWAIEKLQSGLD